MSDQPRPFLQAIVEGIAETLAQEAPETSRIAWHPDSPYVADEVGIYQTISPDGKGTSITLTAYLTEPGVETDVMVQFRLVGPTQNAVAAAEQAISDVFDDRWGGSLGGVILKFATRSSGTSLGQDSTGRLGRTENYRFTVHRPTPHRSS